MSEAINGRADIFLDEDDERVEAANGVCSYKKEDFERSVQKVGDVIRGKYAKTDPVVQNDIFVGPRDGELDSDAGGDCMAYSKENFPVPDDNCEIDMDNVNSGRNARLKSVVTIVGILFSFWLYLQLAPVILFVLGQQGWRFVAGLMLLVCPVVCLIWVCLYLKRKYNWLLSGDSARPCTIGRDKYLRYKEKNPRELRRKLKEDYIDKLPDPEKYVESLGNGNDTETLGDKLKDLRALNLDSGNWLKGFQDFQYHQEKLADGIMWKYVKLIAVKTAASPWKLVDVLCVAANSALMIAGIAKVFHKSVSKVDAYRLLLRWFFNIYISGEFGDIAEREADNLAEGIVDKCGGLSLTMPVLSKFLGKAVEGGVNGYFAYRIGRRAIKEFRAVDIDFAKSENE